VGREEINLLQQITEEMVILGHMERLVVEVVVLDGEAQKDRKVVMEPPILVEPVQEEQLVA
jgi:hypothetical protein